MRSILYVFIIGICTFPAMNLNAQGPHWLWAKCAQGGMPNADVYSGSLDASGNVVLTGDLLSPGIIFGHDTLVNHGLLNFYTVKYDSGGNVLWARSAGGSISDRSNCLAPDASGNVYVTGFFKSPSISFGSYTLINQAMNNGDVFLVKYNKDGDVVWAQRAGGSDDDVGQSVAVDSSGNVYLAGYFLSPYIVFGTDTMRNLNYPAYTCDIFLVKFDSDGNVIWAKCEGGMKWDIPYSVAIDRWGNVCVTGSFNSPEISFGSWTLTNTGNNSVIFTVKYDPGGNVLWAAGSSEASSDVGNSACSDPAGNVCISGIFYGGSVSFSPFTITNSGKADIFLLKYAPGGNVLWATGAGGQYEDREHAISADEDGNVYVAGGFNSPSLVFGPDTLTNAYGGANGFADIFVAKYSSDGQALWAKKA